MSALLSTLLLSTNCSGGIYAGVPSIVPLFVTPVSAMVASAGGADTAMVASAFSPDFESFDEDFVRFIVIEGSVFSKVSSVAIPKSVSLISARLEISILPGFMSR